MDYSIDTTQFKRYVRQLEAISLTAFPRAARMTVNDAAFDSRRRSMENIRTEFVNRNSWTARSIRAEVAKTLDVDKMYSKVGSLTDYMDEQEFGGNKEKRRGKNDAIPTRAARAAGSNKRGVRTRYDLKTMVINKAIKGQYKQQTLLLKVIEAVHSGNRFIYHESKAGKRGIFRVVGGKLGRRKLSRVVKGGRQSGWPRGARLEMVYDLSNRAGSTHIKSRKWLSPALRETQDRMPTFFKNAMNIELRKLGADIIP